MTTKMLDSLLGGIGTSIFGGSRQREGFLPTTRSVQTHSPGGELNTSFHTANAPLIWKKITFQDLGYHERAYLADHEGSIVMRVPGGLVYIVEVEGDHVSCFVPVTDAKTQFCGADLWVVDEEKTLAMRRNKNNERWAGQAFYGALEWAEIKRTGTGKP